MCFRNVGWESPPIPGLRPHAFQGASSHRAFPQAATIHSYMHSLGAQPSSWSSPDAHQEQHGTCLQWAPTQGSRSWPRSHLAHDRKGLIWGFLPLSSSSTSQLLPPRTSRKETHLCLSCNSLHSFHLLSWVATPTATSLPRQRLPGWTPHTLDW